MFKNKEGSHIVCYYKKIKEEGYFTNQRRVTFKGHLWDIWDMLTKEGWINIEELNRGGIHYGKIYTGTD